MFTETFLPATDGVVTRLRHTVEELGGMGDEILVFAPSGEPESYAGARVYGVPGVPFPPYPEKKLCPPHPGVGRALRSFRPDLVHAVNPVVLGAGGVYYARRYGVPLVASYHTKLTAYARHYGLGFAEWLGRAQLKALHNRATVNLCNSEADSDELLRWGVKRVRVWPHGVNSRGFRPGRASGAWRAKLSGGNPEDKILLSVGRLAPEKDLGGSRRSWKGYQAPGWRSSATVPPGGPSSAPSRGPRRSSRGSCTARSWPRPTPLPTSSSSRRPRTRWGWPWSRPWPRGCRSWPRVAGPRARSWTTGGVASSTRPVVRGPWWGAFGGSSPNPGRGRRWAKWAGRPPSAGTGAPPPGRCGATTRAPGVSRLPARLRRDPRPRIPVRRPPVEVFWLPAGNGTQQGAVLLKPARYAAAWRGAGPASEGAVSRITNTARKKA